MSDSPPEPGFSLSSASLRLRAADEPPAPARHASTVALLRDTPEGLEVFLVRRGTNLNFAGGAMVYPGGAVDEADRDPALLEHWAGPAPEAFSRPLLADEEMSRGLVVAAVRETFEEAGVLLATAPAAGWANPERLEALRVELRAGRTGLPQVLEETGLALDAGCLQPFAHWITPESEPRRFDTRFFLAKTPEGQHATHDGEESASGTWMRPADALESSRRGECFMLPPTVFTLQELAGYSSVSQAFQATAGRDVPAILPRLEYGEDGIRFFLPTDPGY